MLGTCVGDSQRLRRTRERPDVSKARLLLHRALLAQAIILLHAASILLHLTHRLLSLLPPCLNVDAPPPQDPVAWVEGEAMH